jgi:hypothetical protein
MTTQSVDGRSLESTEARPFSTAAVQTLSPKSTFGGSSPWELIDSAELARRWNLPASWIRSHCRKRTLDEIPCLRLVRYVRFRWGSPELEAWLASHQETR